jgi:hypothetical protein
MQNEINGYYSLALHPSQINIWYTSLSPRRPSINSMFDRDELAAGRKLIPTQFRSNSHNGKISKIAKKKITMAIKYLVYLSPKKDNRHPYYNRNSEFYINFVTLTLSSQYIPTMKSNLCFWNRSSIRAGKNGKSLIISGVLKNRKTARCIFILLRIVLFRGTSFVTCGTHINKNLGTLLVIVSIRRHGTEKVLNSGRNFRKRGITPLSLKLTNQDYYTTGITATVQMCTRYATSQMLRPTLSSI